LDIAAADTGSNDISVLTESANRSFNPQTEYSTFGNTACVDTGDVNDDGQLDIISASGVNFVSVLRGVSDGTLSLKKLPFRGGSLWIAVADIDHDSKQFCRAAVRLSPCET